MITVEVKGISFDNQGAMLMLEAIRKQFQQRNVKARFVVEPNASFDKRVSFSLWTKAKYVVKGINLLGPIGALPKRLRHVIGVVNESEIDVVLDASGFSYGDQWPLEMAKSRLGNSIRRLNAQGCPVILLPQALGPFEDKLKQEVFSEIAKYATAIFPRDPISLEHLKHILPSDASTLVTCCPDFTNLLKVKSPSDFDFNKLKTCIIPNSKMLAKTDKGESYKSLLIALIEDLQERDQAPFILVHEDNEDRDLAREINDCLGTKVPVIDPRDPLKIKSVIGASKLVISARFHGLVSALSQGIPVLATGWSHKYEQLLTDYGVPNLLLSLEGDSFINDALVQLRKLEVDSDNYHDYVDIIRSQCYWQEQKVQKMWSTVFQCIDDVIKKNKLG